jgi:hypothetical protein
MSIEIKKIIIPTIFYLYFIIMYFRCIFGDYLFTQYDRYSASFVGRFFLVGFFKNKKSYVYFYRLISSISLFFVSIIYFIYILKLINSL